MKRMAVGKFKTQLLAVMDEVMRTGEAVLITKHGKPVAKLVAADNRTGDILGYMASKFKIVGDIVRPVTPQEDWELH
jgi:prevent-host-death family protein